MLAEGCKEVKPVHGHCRRTRNLTAGLCAIAMTLVAATEPERLGTTRSYLKGPLKPAARALKLVPSKASEQGSTSNESVTRVPPGTTVYRNEIDPPGLFYQPGAGERAADDLQLVFGACGLTQYSLKVFSDGKDSFDVHTEIWDGDPCLPESSLIAGTERDFANRPPNVQVLLEATIDPPVPVPGTIWLATTFSTAAAGWFVAEEAEIGFTHDLFSEDDSELGCGQWEFTINPPPFAGFWATVDCNPTGACCDGTDCTEVTDDECVAGTWQGTFTTCDPGACLLGVCCTGSDFSTCNDATEADCTGELELFHPGLTCADDPCRPPFTIYENDFVTGQASSMTTDLLWGDDLLLGPGAPCDLAAFEIIMTGATGIPPYAVHVELWTNDDRKTPNDPDDDIPLAPIPGTETDFTDLPWNPPLQALLAGPFDGIVLPQKVWMVFSVSSENAGPLLGGMADIGSSLDGFAVFNDPEGWVGGRSFGGFNPSGCPGPPPPQGTCIPAGSFLIKVWCSGDPPTGACCNDFAGVCVDDMTESDCISRWAAERSCDSEPFEPPCGTAACCTTIAPCEDRLPSECKELWEGIIPFAIARGSLCGDPGFECPRNDCLSAEGDCFAENPTSGCEDPFCCDTVCTMDPACCSASEWDGICVGLADAHCTFGLVCVNTCGDINGNGSNDLEDFALLENCFGLSTETSMECKCSDLNGNDTVDLDDFAILVDLLGAHSINTPPDCP